MTSDERPAQHCHVVLVVPTSVNTEICFSEFFGLKNPQNCPKTKKKTIKTPTPWNATWFPWKLFLLFVGDLLS